MTELPDLDWLRLREPLDAASHQAPLIAGFVARLPQRPRLVEFGAGIGASFRLLAPAIGRAQAWTLVERDEAALGEAFEHIALWAEARGCTVTWPGRALLVHTGSGAWRVEGRVDAPLDPTAALRGARADAVICSVAGWNAPGAWFAQLADAVRIPVLLLMVPDGRQTWMPAHGADAAIRTGLRRMRDAGGASDLAGILRPFRARGFALRVAPADWRLRRTPPLLATALAHATTLAAGVALPSQRTRIAEWQEARLDQARRGRLAIRIGHRDILALPP